MTNSEIVIAFVDAWNRMDWDAVIGFLDDDVVYHNIPMEKIVGKEGPMALERFARVIEINLVGTFNVLRLAAAAMCRSDVSA